MFGRLGHSRRAVARTPTFILPRGRKTTIPTRLRGRGGGRDLIPRMARDQNASASGAHDA